MAGTLSNMRPSEVKEMQVDFSIRSFSVSTGIAFFVVSITATLYVSESRSSPTKVAVVRAVHSSASRTEGAIHV